MSVSVLLDIFFVSTTSISLQLGSKGLAYSSIASQCSVMLFTLIVCWRMLGIRLQDLVTIFSQPISRIIRDSLLIE